MGWNDEQEYTKKGMNLSSKILLSIIICVIIIIVLIFMLLISIQQQNTPFTIYVDGSIETSTNQETLLSTIDNITYVNIEEFAKLVGYEYHKGEYKSTTIEENKCYVEGKNETASFYLNENSVYKLPINQLEKDYSEYTFEDAIKSQNQVMYAPIEAITKAFNVAFNRTNTSLEIYTLDYLVSIYNTKAINWGYTSIAEQSFENKKALLDGCMIVKKEDGLYKVIDIDNTKEIVLDRYIAIGFLENTQEFFVKNSLGYVGLINLDGTTQIEPMYEEISVLDKNEDLYLVKQAGKYGVVKGNNINIIYPEYDNIGVKNSIATNTSKNQYLILDTLIPVYKDNKWGAYNKSGSLILELEYDEFGYNLTNIEINGIKESVEPVLAIKSCNGVIVKKSGKYGLISVEGKELVPIAVDGIYSIRGAKDESLKYYMLYNGKELNVIQRLIETGLLQGANKEENIENEIQINNTTNNNEVNN